MIDRGRLSILSCINCQGDLKRVAKYLTCKKCKVRYQITQGIPRMASSNKGLDVKISEDRWDVIYQKESISKASLQDQQIKSHQNFLLEFKKYYRKGYFLDLGCGIAKTSLPIAMMGTKVIGIDISFAGLLKSRRLFENNKAQGFFIQGDYLKSPLKNNFINFIYWGLALEYVEQTQQAINESYRILNKGGRIVAAFPVISLGNLTYQQARGDIPRLPVLGEIIKLIHLKILRGKYLRYGYGQSFTTSYIKKGFETAGFRVKKIDYFDTYYPISFIPKILRPLIRKLLKKRLLWPFAYIEAVK